MSVDVALEQWKAAEDRCVESLKGLPTSDGAALNEYVSALDALASETFDSGDAVFDQYGAVDQAFLALATKVPACPAYMKVFQQAYAFRQLQRLRESNVKGIALDVTKRVESSGTMESAAALAKLESERRYYDVATGFVYAWKVGDVMIPTMLAMCPFGCLKRDSGAGEYLLNFASPLSFWERLGHAFSLDVGMKTRVIDKHVDPRNDGSIGFLGGASLNPIDVLRVSGGAYAFENAQTDKWNVTWYMGATLNVIHAAEIMGAFGFAETPKPAIAAE